MYSTYILRSRTTSQFYTGSTANLTVRLEQHNSELSSSTKNRGPLDLIHREEFTTRPEAVRRERFYKTGRGRDEIRELIASAQSRSSG